MGRWSPDALLPFVAECVDGIRRLMDSAFCGPVNIGSEEMIPINGLAKLVMEIAGKNLLVGIFPVLRACAGAIPITG